MSARPAAFAGILLAGGEGARMGRDKATILVDGETLLARAIRVLDEAGAAEVIVAAGTRERASDLSSRFPARVRVVHDAAPREGPLAGIVAGLASATCPLAVLSPLDTPAMTPALVRAPLHGLLDARAPLAAIPRAGNRLQPLHAAVRVHPAGSALAALFARGLRAPMDALLALPHRVVDLEPHASAFADLDTPQDLARRETPPSGDSARPRGGIPRRAGVQQAGTPHGRP